MVSLGSTITIALGVVPSTSCRHCRGWRRCGQINRDRNGRSGSAEIVGVEERAIKPKQDESAQLSVSVDLPTLQVAVVKNGAGVLIGSRHCNGRSSCAGVYRCRRVELPLCGIMCRSTVAQLHRRYQMQRLGHRCQEWHRCGRSVDSATAVRPVPRSVGGGR